jgi:hypothetical protein
MTMAKTVKLTKMASNNYPHPNVSGSEGSIHINLQPYYWLSNGKKGAQGRTYYCQTAKERAKRGE